uniref:Uncharacterized protein n=1 Tax=Rhizophora mucronata TaxID=61149 RepID=A0A2P2IM82_RHIMU
MKFVSLLLWKEITQVGRVNQIHFQLLFCFWSPFNTKNMKAK